jgi:hypothetical protein
MMTEEYRRRFAYLQYGSVAGMSFLSRTESGVREYENLAVFYTADGAYFVPLDDLWQQQQLPCDQLCKVIHWIRIASAASGVIGDLVTDALNAL